MNMNEEFLHGESVIEPLERMLEDIIASSQTEAEKGKKVEKKTDVEVTEDNFIVVERDALPPRSSRGFRLHKIQKPATVKTDKFTFLREIPTTAEERRETRIERENIANQFRAVGNEEFRREKFEQAIVSYTRGLEYIPNTPVLYCNRAVCYMRLKNFKRALIDLDIVIMRLDPKCLKAWLYRAACNLSLGDEHNYEKCLEFARCLNPGRVEFVKRFARKLKVFVI